MMNRSRLLHWFLISMIVLVLVPLAFATPNSINIQGKLTSSSGTLITGQNNFTIRFYDNFTNGTMLYEKNATALADARGIFDLALQGVNLPFDKQYYLGVLVNGDPEMSPRVNLTSAPYSFASNTSKGLNTSQDALIGNAINLTAVGNIYANGTLFSRNIRVSSQLEVGGGFSAGGLTIQNDGTIVTQGDVIFSGNITILNITNLNVNGSIVPNVDSLFDIGNSSFRWRNANFSGTVDANRISAAVISVLDLPLGWTNLTNYPSACPVGQFITTIGDSLTCAYPSSGTTNSTAWNLSNNLVILSNVSSKVGIGTNNPQETLVVIGNVNISGTLNVSSNITFANLIGCDSIDTDANGMLRCGADAGASGGSLTSDHTNNITAYFGSGWNATVLTINNVSTFRLGRFSNDIVATSNIAANITDYLGGADVNASLIKIGNLSGYDTSSSDDFNSNNFTNSSYVNISVMNGKVKVDLNISQALCIALTGNADLCDGADDSGATAQHYSNITEFLGGSSINGSLIKTGNLSAYQLEGPAFKIANATALLGTNESNSPWNQSATAIFPRDQSKSVGIGTSLPQYLLQVGNPVAGNAVNLSNVLFVNGTNQSVQIMGIQNTTPQLAIYNPNAATGHIAGIRMHTASGWNIQLRTRQDNAWLELTDSTGGISHQWNSTNYYPGGSIGYITGSATGLALLNDEVGIGTATPTKRLSVSDGTNNINFDPSATIPTINTSHASVNKNLSIASADGSVIIQLG